MTETMTLEDAVVVICIVQLMLTILFSSDCKCSGRCGRD